MTARELGTYVSAAFYSYEAMRDARDEALTRVGELEEQRDQARRGMASLEGEVAKVRAIHVARSIDGEDHCETCGVFWPCPTARAVYLT